MKYNYKDFDGNLFDDLDDDLDKEAESLVEIYQMRTQHGKKAYGFDDTIYNIFVNLGLNVCYNLSDERERRVADCCLLMTIDCEEAFLRKATDIMEKENATKLLKRVKELSADEDNIALYTDYTNQEMLMNTVMSTAEEMTIKAEVDIAKAKEENQRKNLEIVKSMLANKMDKSVIANIMGLSIEEINSIDK